MFDELNHFNYRFFKNQAAKQPAQNAECKLKISLFDDLSQADSDSLTQIKNNCDDRSYEHGQIPSFYRQKYISKGIP